MRATNRSRPPRASPSRAAPALLRALLSALLLALAAAWAPAADFSEPPRPLAEGIAPILLEVRGNPLAFWQEARTQGTNGQAWIVRSRQEDGVWTTSRVAGPIEFRGAEPILYSAAVSPSGTVALAVATSGTTIAVSLSEDGGMTFKAAGTVVTEAAAVGPRVFPSASGGWMVFLTQAREASAGQDAASATVENTNSIYVASSADGIAWTGARPLVADDENLNNNYLPASVAFGGKDIVVFQNQAIETGDLAAHYVLYSKVSADGGSTWSRAWPLTDYQEPAAGAIAGTATGTNAGPQNYDNQAARLVSSGGRLLMAWQRRFTKGTQVRIASAALDAAGRLDQKSLFYLSSPSGSFILAGLLEDAGKPTVVFLEDRLAANEVWRRRYADGNWSALEALGLTALADPNRAGATSFAFLATIRSRLFALWQYDDQTGTRLAPVARQRVFLLEPVLHVDAPRVSIANYRPGERSRSDLVSVGLAMPRSTAGIARLAYRWSRAGDRALLSAPAPLPSREEVWKSGTVVAGSPDSLRLPATEDGAWVLFVSLEDRAGNRSPPASLTYFRDRTPPDPPFFLPLELDDRGALVSNTLDMGWQVPDAPDLRGYTWSLRGPLDPTKVPASLRRSTTARVPGLSDLEAALIEYYGLPRPVPDVLGTKPGYRLANIDNGWWFLSVAAIDQTGNVSDVATILFRTDKQVPFTLVYGVRLSQDLIGRRSLAIDGRGFLDEGVMARVVLSRSRQQPWDFSRESAAGGFRVASNALMDGITVEDLPAGSYWLGLQHPKRGVYWAPQRVVIDISGTLKYGVEYSYKPSWSVGAQPGSRFSIYDVILAAVALFSVFGILFSTGQAASAWRDGALVQVRVLALVNGGPMPVSVKVKELRKQKRRGIGLQFKFTFFIALLVLFVVLLVTGILGVSMVRNQSQALAQGLDDAARVLLESAAQSGRFFLDKEGAVTQLGFIPAQAKAMAAAEYITITGNSADPKVAGRDVVYATNDPALLGSPPRKVDSSRLELGVSGMRMGEDPLAERVSAIAGELEATARDAIAGDLARKAELARQKEALPRGSAGDQERQRINASLDAVDLSIRDRLRVLSDGAVGSIPAFDTTVLSPTAGSYLFFKPVLEYRQTDQVLYRGMVRLSANTGLIVADVAERTRALLVNAAEIAALVLLVGVLGAFFLSRSIVRPLRRVINAIERMRRTEDKAELEGFKVEVRTQDELSVLANAANSLALDLVEGAKQTKALIEGADIQSHFIPLEARQTIARQDTPTYELFGYYKGAKEVSGDYWNFQKLPGNEEQYYFIKCDVSGKGVVAAFIMVQVGTMVINHFDRWYSISKVPDFDLPELTYRINDFLVARDYKGKFAAFTLGVISMKTGIVTMCHAGDNMFRAWRASTGATIAEPFQPPEPNPNKTGEFIDKGSPASGLIDRDLLELKNSGFYTFQRRIERGDVLLLYSDGIEDAIHYFRDEGWSKMNCLGLPGSSEWHAAHGPGSETPATHNMKDGEDNEHIGAKRIDDYIEAYDRRRIFRLVHEHPDDRDLVMTFDFTKATGTVEERIIAYIAVGRVFCLYDFSASDEEYVDIDRRIDAFLARFLDQYALIFRKRETIMVKSGRMVPKDGVLVEEVIEDPNYVRFRGLREAEQYDDLSIVGIRRK